MLIAWIIEVQCALLKGSPEACTPADFGLPSNAGQPEQAYFGGSQAQPGARAPAADVMPTDMMPPNEDLVSAHAEARRGAQAAKDRNRGSGIFG